jgi:dephospho-CoA kinase
MMKIGLTGSIGMGKSAVSSMFRRLGVPVFDADAEVHKLQGAGGALVAKIEARFPGTTGPKGVDRQKLGAAVLGKPDDLRALERIVHPAVYHVRQHFLRRNRSCTMVVLDIPLLFEKGGAKQVGVTVVVSAPAFLQTRRVLRRPGMTAAKLKHIRNLQVPDHVKRRRADFVINTGQSMRETRAEVRRLITCLRHRKRR